jgi:hypothetical protein
MTTKRACFVFLPMIAFQLCLRDEVMAEYGNELTARPVLYSFDSSVLCALYSSNMPYFLPDITHLRIL